MRLLVVGGSGFVGGRVLRAALRHGLQVGAVSRSGAPRPLPHELDAVDWHAADMQASERLAPLLEDADAVVSCVGVFGSNSYMRQINGDANAALVEAAAAAGVKRFVYISAHTFRPVALVAPGYFEGKSIAEAAVEKHFGSAGCILRPPAIYGTRAVGKHLSLPIGLVGAPLGALLSTKPMRSLASALGPVGDLLTPWVSVDAVADAAIAHVLGGGGGGGGASPRAPVEGSTRAEGPAVVMEWEDINRVAKQLVAARAPEVTLFFDGGCPLCSKEIAYYKRLDASSGRVNWVDIHKEPERLAPYGIQPTAAMRLIHATNTQGELLVGVPAFLAVWEQLPYWNMLPPLIRAVPFGMPLANAAYSWHLVPANPWTLDSSLVMTMVHEVG